VGRVGRSHWTGLLQTTLSALFVGYAAQGAASYHRRMAKAPRSSRSGIAFVTLTTHDRRPVFETARVADLFVEVLLHYRTLGRYKLHAYVAMPENVHLLLTPQSASLDETVDLIKNSFAWRLDTKLPVWQNGFTGYSVANHHDLEIVRAFMHQLPVRSQLAPAAELYPYSSAFRRTPSPESATQTLHLVRQQRSA